ncbi:hypothetical protein HAX54_010515 [Datura stramonium]|uniref:Uncharacterized protein n=1 Tax=Datura stramonium TaxID=4076 RepID=A0ABS8TJ33_DATST|nr:hypothetical protein [Datura stramonium]
MEKRGRGRRNRGREEEVRRRRDLEGIPAAGRCFAGERKEKKRRVRVTPLLVFWRRRGIEGVGGRRKGAMGDFSGGGRICMVKRERGKSEEGGGDGGCFPAIFVGEDEEEEADG